MKKNRILSFVVVLAMLIQLVGTMGVVFAADSADAIVVNPSSTTATGENMTVDAADACWKISAATGVDAWVSVPVEVSTSGYYDVSFNIAAVIERPASDGAQYYSKVRYSWDDENYRYLKNYATSEEPEITAIHVSGVKENLYRIYKLSAPKYLEEGTHYIKLMTNDPVQLVTSVSQVRVREIKLQPVELPNKVTIQGEDLMHNDVAPTLHTDAKYSGGEALESWALATLETPINMTMPFAVSEEGTYDVTMAIAANVIETDDSRNLANMQYKIDDGDFVSINEENFTVLNSFDFATFTGEQAVVVKLNLPVELESGNHTLTFSVESKGTNGYITFGCDYITIKNSRPVMETVTVNPSSTTATGENMTVDAADACWKISAATGVDAWVSVPVEVSASGYYDVSFNIAAVIERPASDGAQYYSKVRYSWDDESYRYLKNYATSEEPEITAIHVSGIKENLYRVYKLSAPKYLEEGTHYIKLMTNDPVQLAPTVSQVRIREVELQPVEISDEIIIQGEDLMHNDVAPTLHKDAKYSGGEALESWALATLETPINMTMPFAVSEEGTYDVTMAIAANVIETDDSRNLANMQYKIDDGDFVSINKENFTVLNSFNFATFTGEQAVVVKLNLPVELESGNHTLTFSVESKGTNGYITFGCDYIKVSKAEEIIAIEIATDSDVVYAGDALNFNFKSQNDYTLAPYDYTDVVYTLSDENIAIIENNVLTAVNTGLLEVTAEVTLTNGNVLTTTKTIYIVSEDGVYVANPVRDGKKVTFDLKAKAIVGNVVAIVARYGTQNGEVTSVKEVKTFEYTNVATAGIPVSHTFTELDDSDVVYILLWNNMTEIKPLFNRVTVKKK